MMESISRRDMLNTSLKLGAVAAAIGGCGLWMENTDRRHADEARASYQETEKEFHRILVQYYKDKNFPNTTPTNIHEAIIRGETALNCIGSLLLIDHPRQGQGYPFINYYHRGTIFWASESESYEDAAHLIEYQNAKKLAGTTRTQLANEVGRTHKFLLQYQSRTSVRQDPIAARYLTCCIPQLEVLEKRIRQGRLMVADNVLTHTNKYGRFAEIVGQTDHYDEVLAELKALKIHLQNN